MRVTLDASRFTGPQLPAVISRDRLTRRLRTAGDNGMILLLGQAAQGKTTLAADYLRHQAGPTAWLFLEPEDAETGRFCRLLIQALNHALPSEKLTDNYNVPRLTMSAAGDAETLGAKLQPLCERLPGPLQIVLDGVERLPEQAPVHALIARMCTALADRVQLWLISRRRPSFQYEQALVKRRLLVLDNQELAFTPREIQLYFEALHQVELPRDGIEQIHQVTGGWPGGLVLLAQHLQRMDGAHWADYLMKELSADFVDRARAYFSEAIFSSLPPDTRSFLMHAAVPEVIDAAMADTLLDRQDSHERLQHLVQSNIFIHSHFDTRRQRTTYRFNRLFRDFLRARFKGDTAAGRRKAFYARLAAYHDDQGIRAEAVTWYLRSGDLENAATIMKKIGTDWVIRGRFSELATLMQSFPDRIVQSDPWLLFFSTVARGITGGAKNLEDYEAILARFAGRKDIRGQMLTLAHLIETCILLGQPPNVCLSKIKAGERWLRSQSVKHYYIWAKTLLWLQIGFGYIAGGFDLPKGLSAAQNACLLARRSGDRFLMTRAMIVSVLGLAAAGEFERADQTLAEINALAPGNLPAEYQALRAMVNLELSLRRGDLPGAQRQIATARQEIEACGLLFIYPAFVDAEGFIQLYEGRYTEAQVTCRHLLDVATLAGNPVYKGLACRLSSLIHYHQGNYIEAAVEAEQAVAAFPAGDPDTLPAMQAKQLLALAWLHLRRHAQARTLLDQALAFFKQTANSLSSSETCLILGLAAHLSGSEPDSRRWLREGFDIAAGHGFKSFILLAPADLAAIVRLGETFRMSVPDFAPPACASRRLRQAPPATVQDANAVQGLEIRTFGGFAVLRNGIALTDDQWGGHRPQLLLKAILVRGMREIPKDLLIDDLWPDSTPDSGLQNFKVTLHRLRKALGTCPSDTRGPALVHLKNNRISLDKGCRVDLEIFLRLCKDIKRCAMHQQTDQILALGQQVMLLYQGDFLPEEPYAPWIEMKRWALRDAYLEVVLKMAVLYDRKGDGDSCEACCRAALRVDACCEVAAQILIPLLQRQGRENEALQVYQQLCRSLHADLGVTPEAATAALLPPTDPPFPDSVGR